MAKKATIDMTATIEGVKYPLYIGFGFLNEIQTLETNEFGGFEVALLGLLEGNPLTVRSVLSAALNTNDDLTTDMIDKYIEQEVDIDKFCKDFLKLLESANLTKGKYKKMMPILKQIVSVSEQEIKRVPVLLKAEMEKTLSSEESTTTK